MLYYIDLYLLVMFKLFIFGIFVLNTIFFRSKINRYFQYVCHGLSYYFIVLPFLLLSYFGRIFCVFIAYGYCYLSAMCIDHTPILLIYTKRRP